MRSTSGARSPYDDARCAATSSCAAPRPGSGSVLSCCPSSAASVGRNVRAPRSGRRPVTQWPVLDGTRPVATTASTASSAILRYVVHLPPVMLSMPSASVHITWSRTTFCVLSPPPLDGGGAGSGRIPLQAESTSSRRTLTPRWSDSVSRTHATSASLGAGLASARHLVSVVPAMSAPCHGSKNSTRPSLVLGTSMPMVAEP
mmetsp:Transcript_24433/g.72452  ORF Transcript_24433/g.72452 Transcript_24433/m.72452 type:complete len:202 (-) Transcript_24433:1053-1658(-)